MSDGIRCPYCKKKLLEALNGTATAYCRHCKHTVTLKGRDLTSHEVYHLLASATSRPQITQLDDGTYEYSWSFDRTQST